MLPLLAAAVLLEPASVPSALRPVRQATASVTIVRGETIRFGGRAPDEQASVVRQSMVRERDGSRRPSTLVEFY